MCSVHDDNYGVSCSQRSGMRHSGVSSMGMGVCRLGLRQGSIPETDNINKCLHVLWCSKQCIYSRGSLKYI